MTTPDLFSVGVAIFPVSEIALGVFRRAHGRGIARSRNGVGDTRVRVARAPGPLRLERVS